MILIVDDDHAITKILSEVLTKAGYAVRQAANGEEAYAVLKEASCKGVLLDMLMPGINGAGLLMLMAAEGIRLPVVVMAGSPDFTADELADFPNVVAVVKKPFYPEQIVELVRRYMPKNKD